MNYFTTKEDNKHQIKTILAQVLDFNEAERKAASIGENGSSSQGWGLGGWMKWKSTSGESTPSTVNTVS